jgi:hypothetical protein
MLPEEGGVELRGWCTVLVEAVCGPFRGAPHFPQNSLSGGTAAAHDGQGLTGFRNCTATRLGNVPLVILSPVGFCLPFIDTRDRFCRDRDLEFRVYRRSSRSHPDDGKGVISSL